MNTPNNNLITAPNRLLEYMPSISVKELKELQAISADYKFLLERLIASVDNSPNMQATREPCGSRVYKPYDCSRLLEYFPDKEELTIQEENAKQAYKFFEGLTLKDILQAFNNFTDFAELVQRIFGLRPEQIVSILLTLTLCIKCGDNITVTPGAQSVEAAQVEAPLCRPNVNLSVVETNNVITINNFKLILVGDDNHAMQAASQAGMIPVVFPTGKQAFTTQAKIRRIIFANQACLLKALNQLEENETPLRFVVDHLGRVHLEFIIREQDGEGTDSTKVLGHKYLCVVK
ncbi:hypothetical protein HOH51_02560 [bacterium]|jgi:hypothetical protein|nr:hypothetical protein [bacterium]